MNASKIKEVATPAATLRDIATNFEDIHVQFYQFRNMLFVFDELLEREVDFMRRRDDVYAQHFVKRYDMFHSVIEVMQLRIDDAIDAMRVQIDAVYEADKKAWPQTTG